MKDELEDMFEDAFSNFSLDDAAEKSDKPIEPVKKRKPAHYYRHKAFVKEYFKNGNNGAQAYADVYKIDNPTQCASSASRLLETDSIIKLMEEEREFLSTNHNIDLEYNVRVLHRLIEECLEDGDKHHLTKAIDTINKMAGAYTHKQQIDHKHEGITFNFVKPENKTEKDSE